MRVVRDNASSKHSTSSATAASAPVPAQIFSAKKVFISNASALGETPSGVADLTYNEFYADIKDWGRYEIVSAPVDADLVFEIRFTSEIGAKNVVNELAALRRIFSFAWLFLIPKRAPSCGPSRRACPKRPIVRPAEKKIDDAMTAIVNDVKKLTSQPAAANGPAAK